MHRNRKRAHSMPCAGYWIAPAPKQMPALCGLFVWLQAESDTPAVGSQNRLERFWTADYWGAGYPCRVGFITTASPATFESPAGLTRFVSCPDIPPCALRYWLDHAVRRTRKLQADDPGTLQCNDLSLPSIIPQGHPPPFDYLAEAPEMTSSFELADGVLCATLRRDD